jgi:anti-anti-sigma factor
MVKPALIEVQDSVTVVRFPPMPVTPVQPVAGPAKGVSGPDAARTWIASEFLTATAGVRLLVVDLDGIPALDSAALGPLIQRLREMQANRGRMALCGVTAPALREVFSLTRFDQVFPIYPTPAEAVRAVREEPSSRFARSR